MHRAFHYAGFSDIQREMEGLGLKLPLDLDTKGLKRKLEFGGHTLQNRLAVQPMEGQDAEPDGSPSALTKRRYLRFAKGGAALNWFEAVAVTPEGRANPKQLMITEKNLPAFQGLLQEIREEALRAQGFAPMLVAQLTHSGRYSKPDGSPAPLIAASNKTLEGDVPLDQSCIVSDEYLKALPEKFARATKLCREAGFDGVDIKACHRYLLSELLCAFERKGPYGGSLENRARALLEAMEAAKAEAGDMLVTCRLNLYDGFPYPDGFGVREGRGLEIHLEESLQLVSMLHEGQGLPLLNLTIGNPYKNPHVNRPYDRGGYVPPEHPFVGLDRMMGCIKAVKQAFPGLAVVGSGFSYLRQFSPYMAAGAIEQGVCDVAGFGRMAFANPGFAADVLSGKALLSNACCVCCGKCTELMRAGAAAGCAVRDPKYTAIYTRDVLGRG